MAVDTAAHRWLLSRIDGLALDATAGLVESITEHLAVATADAVTVRALSADGTQLVPLVAHHPDPERGAAMAEVMGRTVQRADSGVWQPVLDERRTMRWQLPPGFRPPEASPDQVAFLEEYPVRAIMGTPLVFDDTVLGGVSVVRFGADEPFTDADEALLIDCASRIAATLAFREAITSLG